MDIHHHGVTVSNLERALEFYTEILSFNHKRTKTLEGELVSQILGLGDVKFNVAFLEGDDVYIELFEFCNPEPPLHEGPQPNNAVGATHIAIEVEGVEEWFDENSERIKYESPPVSGTSGATVMYINDPDGNVIEIVEKGKWSHW